MQTYSVSVLEELEAGSIQLLREIAGEHERPALVLSGDPESQVLERLAAKAFAPGPIPFAKLAHEAPGHDALILARGGGNDGSRGDLWNIYNGRLAPGETARVYPLSGWTKRDLADYLEGKTSRDETPDERLRFVLAGSAGSGKSALLDRLQLSTARRRFLAMDTDGAGRTTRALASGASRADLALLVLDAERGLSAEARRDALLCSLFGIPRLAVAVNKMDLAGYARERFDELRAEFEAFAVRLGFKNLTFVPVSAVNGDNVAARSAKMAWYDGRPLLEHLERVYIGGDRNLVDLRLPVQYVLKANGERWLCGQVASGVLKVGDEIVAVPSLKRSRVRAITLHEQARDYAYAPLSVAVALEGDPDIGRGAVLAHPRNMPRGVRELEAMVVWLGEPRLERGSVYLLKLGPSWVRASCSELAYRVDPDTLQRAKGDGSLGPDDIGRAHFTLFEERFVDPYARDRATGAFLVVDPASGTTLGAGTIVDRESERERLEREEAAKRHVTPIIGKVSREERMRLLRHRAATVWLTGLSGSGKSTLATELERRLVDAGCACFMLDGDNVRAGINRDLGFGPEDRRENIRRIAEVARLMNDAGLIVVTAFISPYRADRDMARAIAGAERFLEVHVRAPLEVCEKRDVKGLYAKARRGEIPEFTGVSAPYEAPPSPEIVVETAERSIEDCVRALFDAVIQKTRLL